MKYACNDEGVEALKGMAKSITDVQDEISSHAQKLRSVGEIGNLGPHVESINDAADNIESAINDASDPIEDIADTLNDVAEGYEDVIANDRIRSAGGN